MSRLPFELQLALRYLRPKRTFVSVITLISVVGVMLGVAVLIIVISVMTGFDRQLQGKILGFNAPLKVYGIDEKLDDYQAVAARVATNSAVTGVAPFVFGRVLVEAHSPDGKSRGDAPIIRGVNPVMEAKVSRLPQSVIAGKFDLSGTGLVIGSEFARKMNLRVGDYVDVYSIPVLQKMRDSAGRGHNEIIIPDEYEVRGIFNMDYFEYDDMFIICSLKNAQSLYGFRDEVHGLLVTLRDPYQADQVGREIQHDLGLDYVVGSWLGENNAVLSALKVEKNVMFYLLFFIMIVAAFGIASALITFVVQKTREIGMLKAIGATGPQIVWLFLSQSLMVGILGVVLGFGLGWLGIHYRNEFLTFMRRATGFELFPSSVYNFSELPAQIVPGDIAIICGGSLVICVLAGLIPAWNAGRLKPVEALRHE